jgi:hypothetical protein
MIKNYFKSAAAAMLLAAGSKAQVATLYTFSQQSSVYTSITGGTVFGTTSSDDEVFVDPSITGGGFTGTGVGIPIGFTFMFNNNLYNRIAIQNNGYISFGHSSLSPAVDINTGFAGGISVASTAPAIKQDRVVPFGRDLQAQTGASIRVETIGSVPTRTCVVQWTNYRKFNATGDSYNFQVRLMETTNIVEVAYGTFSNNATSGTAEVGIRGNSNTDFNNRIVNTTNPWNASIPGTANNSAATVNNTLVPASGQSYKWTPAQCSGSFSNLTAIASPTLVCPNYGGTVSVLGTSTLSGITYTWYESDQSAVGNWTLVSGAEAPFFNTPTLVTTHWYQAQVTCINSASSGTTSSAEIQVAGTTTSSVPYFEGFENIPVANVLPNCSWFATGLGTSFQTYIASNTGNRIPRSGNNFAAYTAPTATNFVYTNGIQMEPGITYSAALWYATDFAGSNNWTNLTILIGNAQNVASQVSVTATSPAISGNYKLLSGLFTVPSSGLYYMAIRATGGTAGAPYLMIDDISITIPCTPESGNSPTVTAQGAAQTACFGQPFAVSANGADVYSWSDNSSGSSTVVTPGSLGTNTFVVAGTRTLTGCSSTAAVLVTVFAPPVLNVQANPPVVCQGKSVVLTASGANQYNWSSGGSTSQIVVTPANSTNFVVVGTATNNCTASASVSVTVLPLPSIDGSATRTFICVGESTQLMGSNGDTYIWTASKNSNLLQGGTVTINPSSSDNYTVTGTGSNGCQNTDMVTIVVDECNGIAKTASAAKLNVYPNPTAGEFVIEGLSAGVVEVSDLSGRILLAREVSGPVFRLNISEFSNGVYSVKVGTSVIKLVKE